MWCPYTTPARCTELACGNIAPIARSNAWSTISMEKNWSWFQPNIYFKECFRETKIGSWEANIDFRNQKKTKEWKRTQNMLPRKENAGTVSRNAGAQEKAPTFVFRVCCITPQLQSYCVLDPTRPQWAPWNGDLNLFMAAAARRRQRDERRRCKIWFGERAGFGVQYAFIFTQWSMFEHVPTLYQHRIGTVGFLPKSRYFLSGSDDTHTHTHTPKTRKIHSYAIFRVPFQPVGVSSQTPWECTANWRQAPFQHTLQIYNMYIPIPNNNIVESSFT